MPSKRLSVSQARTLLVGAIPLVYLTALKLGAHEPALRGMVLTWIYNDLKGSDENPFIRNLVNAFGLTMWSIGTTQVACGSDGHTLSDLGQRWLYIVSLVIFTTLQIQDFRDQAGDRKKARRTAPLIYGDGVMRWVTASIIIFWSLALPTWWALGYEGYLLPTAFGGLIAYRLLRWRDRVADEKAWKMWALWMTSLFALPLHKSLSVL